MNSMKIFFAISIVMLTVVSGAQQSSGLSKSAAITQNSINLRGERMHSKLVPSAKEKLQAASDKFLRSPTSDSKGTSLETDAKRAAVDAFPGHLTNAGSGDIEAIAFIVLMQAAKDMESDLKEMMNSVKAINDRKKHLQDQIATIKANQPGIKNGIQDDSRTQSGIKTGIQDDSRNQTIIKKKFSFTFTETKHLKIRLPIVVSEKIVAIKDPKMQTEKLQSEKDTLGDISNEMSLKIQMYQERHSRFMQMLSNMMKKLSDTDSAIISNLK